MTHMEKEGHVKHVLFKNKSVDPSNARDALVKRVAATRCDCYDLSASKDHHTYLTCPNCREFARILYGLEEL